MKLLADVCQQISSSLKQIEASVAVTESDLASFEKHTASWPRGQIKERLLRVSTMIKEEASRLLAEHGGVGIVSIWMENGIGLIGWRESKNHLVEKDGLVEEVLLLIEDMVNKLEDGNWIPAVTWLNNHSIYTGKEKPLG